MRLHWLLALAVPVLSVAQLPGTRPGLSPVLRQVDSIDLIETDSLFVGRAIGFAIAPDGRYYVSDDVNTVVHEFDSRGRHLRSFGRKGRGPGEFNSVGFVAVSADNQLYVDGGANLHVFDLTSGDLKWQRPAPAKMIQAMVPHRGRIYLNSVVGRRLANRTSIASVAGKEDSVVFGGPLPAPLGRHPAIDQSFSVLQFAFLGGDTLVYAVTATSDMLFVGSFRGGAYDSIAVGRQVRRGRLLPSIAEKIQNNPAAVTAADVFQPSNPWALASLSGGRFGYLTHDPELTNNRVTGPLHLSVVDRRSRRTCPDALVPVTTDPQPRALFRGDTLIVLTQDETAAKQPRTTIRRFTIQTENCRWIP